MKNVFYILLFTHLSNCVAMQRASSVAEHRRRVGAARADYCKLFPTKTVQTNSNKKLDNQHIMGYVFVPVATFFAAAAVFNAYKDL